MSKGEGRLRDERIDGAELRMVDAAHDFAALARKLTRRAFLRQRLFRRQRIRIAAACRHGAVPEITLIVVFQNGLAREQHEPRDQTGGNHARHDQPHLARIARKRVGDELRQAETIDETGENEAGREPKNRHRADLIRVTETRREQRQRHAEGDREQASEKPPDRYARRVRFIDGGARIRSGARSDHPEPRRATHLPVSSS